MLREVGDTNKFRFTAAFGHIGTVRREETKTRDYESDRVVEEVGERGGKEEETLIETIASQ